ncbi:MAG TPA: GIY-YIG nuclease family protein [Thermoanaerobaculia bacterium]
MNAPAAWCVYILSNRSHTLYIGSTNDLLRRLREHKAKRDPAAFTARYEFDRLVYYEFLSDELTARARELELKGWSRAKKVLLIQGVNRWWLDLTPDLLRLLRLD